MSNTLSDKGKSKLIVVFRGWGCLIWLIVLPIGVWVCPLTADLIGNRSYFALQLVPVPNEASKRSTTTENSITGWHTIYEITLSPEQINEYYRENLLSQGWSLQMTKNENWYCIKATHFTFTTVNISITKIRDHPDSRVLISLPPRVTLCEL